MTTTNTNQDARSALRAIPGGGQPEAPSQSQTGRPARFGQYLAPIAVATVITMFGVNSLLGGHASSDRAQPDGDPAPKVDNWNPTITTVKPGEGAEAVGMRINPEVYKGPSSSMAESQAVTQDIQRQAGADHILQAGQAVLVPDQHPDTPK